MASTMSENNPTGELRRSRQSMLRMHWGLVGLSGLLAVVLLASGSVVIGGIIGVMAVVRTVMLFRWHQAHKALGRQFTGNAPLR
jgi:hypothetical protein